MSADVIEAVETSPASTAATPRSRRRSVLGGALIAVLVLGVALVGLQLAASTPSSRGALDPESAKESGSLALAELLRAQGVEVTVVRTRAEAERAITAETTLALASPPALSDEAVSALIAPAESVVFLSSSARLLRILDLGEDAAGALGGTTPADCTLPELGRIGLIQPERLFSPADAVTGCFPGADGDVALLVDEEGGVRRALIEGTALFSNAHLAENGNAALGLALLGQTGHVVWYVPSAADSDLTATGTPTETLASLTPGWVTPAIVLLLIAGITAGIWRGRRFGPLVAETLPVTVRASETMRGRARLTAQSADAAHAAAELRRGTIRRLARRLGLTARADPALVADAAADRVRAPRGSLHELLLGPLPTNDPDLIDTARRLAELEAAVDATAPGERTHTP